MNNWKIMVENGIPKVTSEAVGLFSRVAAEVWSILGPNRLVGLESISVTFFEKKSANYPFAQIVVALRPKKGMEEFGKVEVAGVFQLLHMLSDDKVSPYIQVLAVFRRGRLVGISKFHTDGKTHTEPAVIAKHFVVGIRAALSRLADEIAGRETTLREVTQSFKAEGTLHSANKYRYIEDSFAPPD